MSFGLGGLFFGLHASEARRAATDASIEAGRSTVAARSAAEQVRQLGDRFDQLAIVCMAMWSLLQERTDLSEEDLMERVREIDLRDGVEDGKVTKQVLRCPKCDRVMHPRHKKCLYCGTGGLKTSAFDQVT